MKLSGSFPQIDGRRETLDARVRSAFAATRAPALINIPNALALLVILWPRADIAIALTWFAAIVLVATARSIYCFAALARADLSKPAHRRAFLILTAANGGLWGGAAVLFADQYPSVAYHAIIFMIAGMTAGASATTASYRPAFFAYAIPAVLPAAHCYLQAPGYEGKIMGGVLIVYLVVLTIATGGHFRRSVAAARHEMELERSMAQLVEKNEETKRLAEKYRLAAEKAEKASRAKSTFLGNMSHELRTPLNGMIGLMKFAFETEDQEKRQTFQQTALKSAGALVAILDDVLALTEADAGMLHIDRKEFDIRECIATAMALFQAEAEAKALRFVAEISPNVPQIIESDPQRVRQVLVNLVGNAVKFTESGAVTVRADMRTDCVQPELQIEVIDTGVGVAPDAAERIFDRFTQADESTTRRFGGAGLGLAVSREIVERMGDGSGAKTRRRKAAFSASICRSGPRRRKTRAASSPPRSSALTRNSNSRQDCAAHLRRRIASRHWRTYLVRDRTSGAIVLQ
ncbi:MAG: hypothetical protein Tsb0010_10770 [Parvularculaceae bacterium]